MKKLVVVVAAFAALAGGTLAATQAFALPPVPGGNIPKPPVL